MLYPEEYTLLYQDNVTNKIVWVHKSLFLYNVKNQEKEIAL